jgi:D-alanyl-D-alanine dipeptidase
MRRLIIWLLAAVLLLCGCGKPEQPEPPETETVTEAITEAVSEAPTEAATAVPTEPPTELPETEPTEPPEDDELVRVRDFIPGIREELAYATEDNFTGERIYDFYNAYLRYGTVKKLAAVCKELESMGLGILIWDGFRPVSAQAALWEICPVPRYVSHPVTGTRAHCRGNAVDLTLFDLETGEKLLMPTGFDDFSALADRDYSDCSEEAAENARLLECIMEKHGFKPYRAEWWHYTDTDSYEVEEKFQPPVG